MLSRCLLSSLTVSTESAAFSRKQICCVKLLNPPSCFSRLSTWSSIFTKPYEVCSSSWCSTSSPVNIVPSFFRSSTELSGFRSNGYKRASFSLPRNDRLTSSSWCHHDAQASLFNTLATRASFSHEYNKYIYLSLSSATHEKSFIAPFFFVLFSWQGR